MKAENIKYKWLFFWYVMVCLSGLYEVQLHFNKRNLFQEYQAIVSQTQRLEIEWRELQLDYSALTSGQKIGFTAKEEISMKLPDSRKINLLKKDETN